MRSPTILDRQIDQLYLTRVEHITAEAEKLVALGGVRPSTESRITLENFEEYLKSHIFCDQLDRHGI